MLNINESVHPVRSLKRLCKLALVVVLTISLWPVSPDKSAAQQQEQPITMVAYGDVHYYDSQAGLRSMGDTWSATVTADGTVLGQHDDGIGIWDGDYGMRSFLNSRMFRLQGVPEDPSAFRGSDYVDGELTVDNPADGYHSSPYEVDGVLYIWSFAPPNGIVAFHNPVLRKSTDGGLTWTTSANSAALLGTKFGWPSFYQYGPGGIAPSPAVDGSDEYVYMLSPSGGDDSATIVNPYHIYYRDHYYLMRVKRTDLPSLDATKFEFYKGGIGGDGSLALNWSANVDDVTPIYTDVGKLAFGWPVYNAALQRYVMTSMMSWDQTPSPFWVLEAPHPWGPWTKVYDHQFTKVTTAGLTHFAVTQAYQRNNGQKMWAFASGDAMTQPSTYEFHYMPIYLTQSPKTTIEAENATALGGVMTASTKSGYTGGGYRTGFTTVGDGVTFQLNAVQSGYHIISFKYANTNSSEGQISVYVNGVKQTRAPVTSTEQFWGSWTEDARVYYLNEGNNSFTLKLDSGDASPELMVDQAAFAFLQTDNPDLEGAVYQSEAATLGGGAISGSTDLINYRGSGYARLQATGSSATFNIHVPETGEYKLYTRYTYGNGQHSTLSNVALKVDGTKLKNISFGTTYYRKLETEVETISLSAGTHTIAFQAESDSGQPLYLDYIQLVGSGDLPAAPEAWTPVDDSATGRVSYSGNWLNNTNDGYWRQNFHFSTVAGSYAEFTFNGTGVQWIGSTNNDHGKADVYIDGVYDRTVDTYTSSWHKQQVLYSRTGLSRGTHTIRVQVRSDKNASSSDYYTDIDAFKYASLGSYPREDDRSASASYSAGWISNKSSGYEQNTVHYSNIAGSSMEYEFTGSGIEWIGSMNNDHGKADVYMDGLWKKTVDTYSPTWKKQQVLFAIGGLSYGTHTLRIEVRSDKNASSSDYFSDVDSFVRIPYTSRDDSATEIIYTGSWVSNTSAGYMNESVHYTNAPGDKAEFTFQGTGVQWIGGTNVDHGITDVYIDGTLVRTVDTYSSAWSRQQILFEIKGLTPGSHTLELRLRSDKHASSTDYYMDVDAFVVYP